MTGSKPHPAHQHGHHHQIEGGATGGQSVLIVAFVLTIGLMALEIAVGLRANSLALLSDAGHILTDVFALGLAWFAIRRASRPADARYTFGYGRSGILAAFVNAIVLIVIAIVIGFEAINRYRHPETTLGLPVIIAASVAVVVNLFIASKLAGGAHGDLNLRAALLHVVGDIAASLAVIVSGLVVILTGWQRADPLVSVLIAGLIAFGAWRIVNQSLAILMEATPEGMDLEAVAAAMQEVPGVEGVHALHVWALSDGFRLLSAHITVPNQSLSEVSGLLYDVRALLKQRYDVRHSTIEVECVGQPAPVSRPITLHNSEPRR